MKKMHRSTAAGHIANKIQIASANCASHFNLGSGERKNEILAMPSHKDRPRGRLEVLYSPIGQS